MSSCVRLAQPVISVGNLSMGGRGKTPVAALVARALVAAGERPAILTRGYRRRIHDDGVVVVSDGQHLLADVDRAGDEPMMLARLVPGAAVLVCDVRAIAGALAEEALGATVHVLDDGFQHRALARDVDIVMLAAGDVSGRRIPFGRLREPVSALKRAHALIVDGPVQDVKLPPTWNGERPLFSLTRALGTPVSLDEQVVWPQGGKVVAFAGIAGPGRFAASLEEAGWTVTEMVGFPDHHLFDRGDLQRLCDRVARTGSFGALTTEKDAMRLRPLRPIGCSVAYVPLVARVVPEDHFERWILDRVRAARLQRRQ